MTAAAAALRVSRRALYKHRTADPVFKQAWEEAYDCGADALEDELVRLGFEEGNVTALIFLLKGARPEKYADRNPAAHVS